MPGNVQNAVEGAGDLPSSAQSSAQTGAQTGTQNPPGADASGAASGGLVDRLVDRLARRVKSAHLARLIQHRGQVLKVLGNLPERMHLVANQTQLVLELADDYRTGVYRQIPWRSIAVMVGIAVYVFSPLDLIPDALAGFGVIDDMLLIGLGARLMREDLEAYCAFKGYDPTVYFGPA